MNLALSPGLKSLFRTGPTRAADTPATQTGSEPDASEADILAAPLARVRRFYANGGPPVRGASLGYRRLLARYYALLFPPDASVLEVGCGAGDLLALLPNRDVAGVDLCAAPGGRGPRPPAARPVLRPSRRGLAAGPQV